MGYSVQSYLVESAKIKQLYGSKDKVLLSTLLEKFEDKLEDLNATFCDDAQKILADIINGEVRFPELAFMYGYVYEFLCEYFGKKIFPPNEEYSSFYYWSIPNKETYKAFIPIPFSDDFPEIYNIAETDLEMEKQNFLSVSQIDGINEEDLQIEKESFEFAFDKALEQKKDLVFFLY